MSDSSQPPPPPRPRATEAPDPERLELRATPGSVARINRRMLLGALFIVLLLLAGIVIVAFNPPRLKPPTPSELFSTENKPTPDGLSKLPSSYDRLGQPARAPEAPSALTREPPKSALTTDPVAEAQRAERARLARLAGQARDSGVFFRLQSRSAPAPAEAARPTPFARPEPQANTTPAADNAAFRALMATARRTLDPELDDGGAASVTEQGRKLSFLEAGPRSDALNKQPLVRPPSPYMLMAGTIIPASLVTGLNSDLPGFVIAQVTEHVYDTVTGRHLLVPQGARLVGKYDHVVAFGQTRALVVWQRIILPDGASIIIDNLPATDTGGYAGLADEVDLHTWQLLKGVALATVLGVGTQLTLGDTESDLVKALRQSTQSTTNRAGQRLVERQLNVQPTVTVRPGWPLRVIVHKDLAMRPYRLPSPP